MALNRKTQTGTAAHEIAVAVLGAVALATTVSLAAFGDEVQTSKFAHTKRTIVPSSRFQRHFDNDTVSDELAPPPAPTGTSDVYAPISSGSNHTTVKPGKYGLIPPPPPLTPTVLPEGMPGLPAGTPVGLSAGSARAGSWSNVKHVTADPKSAATSKYSTASSASTKYVGADPKSAAALARAQAKIEPLLANNNYAAAQYVLETYSRAYPKDKGIRSELSKVATKNAENQLTTNPDAAASAAREALRANPYNVDAKNILSQALKKKGVNVESAAERVKVADTLFAQGRESEAAIEYNESLKVKASADAYVGLGNVAAHTGRHDLARQEYQKALETNPNSAAALRQMGILRLQQGDVVGANTDLSRALVLNSDDTVAATQLIDLWQKQVARNPNQVNGHLGLGRAYLLSGDLKSSQEEYRQVARIDPQNANLPAARQSFKLALARQEAKKDIETAKSLEASGQLVDAHQKAFDAVGLCPGNIPMRLYQGQLSQKLGLNSEAQIAYSEVLKEDPTNEVALAGLRSLPSGTAPAIAEVPPPVAPSIAGSLPMTPSIAGSAQDLYPIATNQSATSPAGTVTNAPMGLAATAGALTAAGATGLASAAASATASGAPPPSVIGTMAPAIKSGELPPAPYLPSPTSIYDTSPPVATMSSFLGQMRGLAETVQAQSGQLGAAVNPLGSGSSLGTAGGLAGLGADSSAVSQALTGSSNLPTADSLPAIDSSGVNSTLAQAAAALKAAGVPSSASSAGLSATSAAATTATAATPPPGTATGAPPTMSPAMLAQLAQQYAPMLQNSNGQPLTQSQVSALYQRYRASIEQRIGMTLPATLPPEAAAAAVAASRAAAGSSASSMAPPTVQAARQSNELQTAYQRMGSLEQQNQALKSQLAQMQAGHAAASAATAATAATQTASASPAAKPAGLAAPLRGPMMDVPASAVAMAMSPVEPVKLELVGVQPTPLDIRLKVILKNAQTTPLKVPAGTKAVVMMNGKQRLAKVSFPANIIPAGGQLEGTIKVSGHDLNPSADLWLPDLLPGKGAERDLHLTVPTISSL